MLEAGPASLHPQVCDVVGLLCCSQAGASATCDGTRRVAARAGCASGCLFEAALGAAEARLTSIWAAEGCEHLFQVGAALVGTWVCMWCVVCALGSESGGQRCVARQGAVR